MRAAILNDSNIVTGIIVADSTFAASIGAIMSATAKIGDLYDGTNFVVNPADIVTERAALIKQIDVDTDAIYLAVQGNRSAEYILAESEANAFKAAGYTGPAPSSVQSWATAKGWTTTQSADNIIATAAAWRGAQAQIRATRLLLKEQAKVASSVNSLQGQWAAFTATVKAQLGVL